MAGLGLTIGGWFGSAFVSVLVEKASSFALRLLGPRSDLQDEINRLTISLCTANAALGLADGKRTSAAHKDLAAVVAQLRDAAYDAEDLLADLEYDILRRKIEGTPHQAGNFLSSPLSFATNLLNSNRDGDDFAAKARGVRKRLDAVSNDMQKIINLLNLEDAVGRSPHGMLAPKPESSSFPTKPQMVGRDEEKETLIQLLLRSAADGSGSSAADPSVSVLPIVGIGGVGKTTLAQFVYHDPRVHEYFQLKMWVCVSNQPFDVKQLTKEILESNGREGRSDATNLNCLQVKLKEKVTSMRYLLVLDDVWNEDGREWERLYAPLKYGLQGSTIIVTTRSPKVVEVMTGALDPIFLKGLLEDVYLEFFKTCAFGSESSEDHPEMEEIAKQIAAKLKGSPLAAKTLGGLLNSNPLDVRQWRSIMNSEIWELQQDENGIMPALRLSYEYLPSHLKRCFSFCSIYPQDYKLDASELVELWIAQGFVAPQANMLLEDTGKGYLLDLASRSFFQKDRWGYNSFQIHDLMHDLAQYVSKNECFRIQNDHQGIPSSIRHLSILCTENLKLHELMDSGNFSKLRSLVYFSRMFLPEINPAIERWFDQLQYIRVLILRYFDITELPESIGNLKHLRFLEISSKNIKRLPESFCSPYNLQVLDIKNCPFLVGFPRGFANLVNLRKIRVRNNLVSSVTEIGKLTNLQNLNSFEVRKEHGRKIDELKNLNQLRGHLRLANLENVESKEDACQANLDKKEYIDALTLWWSFGSNTCTGSLDTEVLEGLKPHRDLKKLYIQYYRGEKPPSWLRTRALPYLNSLVLAECPGITDLPCLPPSLKELILFRSGLKSFPILWGESSIDQGISAQGSSIKRSSLSRLYVNQCHNLTSFEEGLLPECLPSIKSIEIVNCKELVSLPVERFKDFISLEKLDISNFPKLTSSTKLELNPSITNLHLSSCGELDQSLPSCLENLTSLTRLDICRCLHLECLPGQVMHHMRALSHLEIKSCPELRSLGGLEALTSLCQLIISGCPKLAEFKPLQSDTERSQESGLFDEGDDQERPQILTSLIDLRFEDCPNLQSLPVERFEDSISFRKLYIKDCPKLTGSNKLELNPSITNLHLESCGELDRSLPSCLENLTSLSRLVICRCLHLECLPGQVMHHMRALRDLQIKSCPELRLLGGLEALTSLDSLTISGCPKLTEFEPLQSDGERSQESVLFDEGDDQERPQILTSLRDLRFRDCPNLQSLPAWLHSQTCLHTLSIYNCPAINSLPENGLPTSLRSIYFDGCHPMLTEQLEQHKAHV